MAFYDNRGFKGKQRYYDVSQPLMGFGSYEPVASYEPVSGLGISYDREAAKYGSSCGCSGYGLVTNPGVVPPPAAGPPSTPSLPFVESDQAANTVVQMAIANNKFSAGQLDRRYACTTETVGGDQTLKSDDLVKAWGAKGLFTVVYIGSEACPGIVFAGLTPAEFVTVTDDVAKGRVKAKVYVGALPNGAANTMDNYLTAWTAATTSSASASGMAPVLIVGALALGVFYVASKTKGGGGGSMVANRHRRRRLSADRPGVRRLTVVDSPSCPVSSTRSQRKRSRGYRDTSRRSRRRLRPGCNGRR